MLVEQHRTLVVTEQANLSICGLEIPPTIFTLEGFRNWVDTLPDHGPGVPRVCFSRGRVFLEMSPQSYHSQGAVGEAINTCLRTLSKELDLGRYCMPPSWFTHEPAGLSTEPDGLLVLWESFESGRTRINPEREHEMVGPPDMVLEIVSKSSVRKDLSVHVEDYAAGGIAEYWIVDARQEAIDFRILVLTGGSYETRLPDDEGWIDSPLWGRGFRLRRTVDRAGLPDFELDVR